MKLELKWRLTQRNFFNVYNKAHLMIFLCWAYCLLHCTASYYQSNTVASYAAFLWLVVHPPFEEMHDEPKDDCCLHKRHYEHMHYSNQINLKFMYIIFIHQLTNSRPAPRATKFSCNWLCN